MSTSLLAPAALPAATLAVAGGSTLTDAWANAMADIGVRVQGAKLAATQAAVSARSRRRRTTATPQTSPRPRGRAG